MVTTLLSKADQHKILGIFVIACIAFGQIAEPAFAEESQAHNGERAHLLGDWGGARSSLAARGIIVDLDTTQFYQGVVDGSAGTNDWQYGGKVDLTATLLGERLGLWKGLVVNAHLEGRYGDDVNSLSGLSPANAAMLMPNSMDTLALTQLTAAQFLSPELALTGGKYNIYDFVEMGFHTGRGVDSFMNTSLVLPLGLGRTVPTGILAGGLLKLNGKEVQGGLLAYDPNGCATTSCLEDPFEDVAIVGLWKFFTESGPATKDSSYVGVGAIYSNKQYTIVDPQSFVVIPGQGFAFAETDTSWALFSVVNQRVWSDPTAPSSGLNFKGMYTITDGEANPIKWSATAALEMHGLIPRREHDVFGVGYFHAELSDGFKDAVGPLLSLAETISSSTPTFISIEDTDGFEAYYKAQIAPWLAVTGNLQLITETISTEDTKVVLGTRAKVTF
jgi:porin